MGRLKRLRERLKNWWTRFTCEHKEDEFVRSEILPVDDLDYVRLVHVYRCKKCGWEFV